MAIALRTNRTYQNAYNLSSPLGTCKFYWMTFVSVLCFYSPKSCCGFTFTQFEIMDHNNHRINKIKLLLLTATYLAVRNRSRRKRRPLKRTPKQTSHQQLPSQLGEYRTICRQLEQNPACNYLLYLRMTETHFRKLLKLVEPHLIGGRRSSSLVDTAKVKLVVTLRYNIIYRHSILLLITPENIKYK